MKVCFLLSLASVGREEISSCQSKNVTDCYYPIKIELFKNQISKNQNGFYLASKCIFQNISLTLKFLETRKIRRVFYLDRAIKKITFML